MESHLEPVHQYQSESTKSSVVEKSFDHEIDEHTIILRTMLKQYFSHIDNNTFADNRFCTWNKSDILQLGPFSSPLVCKDAYYHHHQPTVIAALKEQQDRPSAPSPSSTESKDLGFSHYHRCSADLYGACCGGPSSCVNPNSKFAQNNNNTTVAAASLASYCIVNRTSDSILDYQNRWPMCVANVC
jgi:hypothetical protein